jgi:predicted nucleotidyltransferase
MARRDEIIAALKANEAELRARGVSGLYLFGSTARGDDRPGSDVDLFFDHPPGFGLEIIGIIERLRDILPGEVDVTTRRSLHPLLRPGIEASAVRVF